MGHENTGRKNKITRMKERVTDVTPGAWVVSSNDRGRKKIYRNKTTGERKIYLQDQEEFEIELYNPTKDNVLAVIHLDGKPISKSGILIRKGQRAYLDCFIDDGKKFIFETYDVENTNEVNEAIATNGNLEVFFYKEEIAEKYDLPKIIERHYHHYRDYYWQPYRKWWEPYYYTNGTINITNSDTTTNLNLNDITFGGTTTNANFTYDSNNATFTTTGSVDLSNALNDIKSLSDNIKVSASNTVNNLKSKIETGQVGKGSKSDQKFKKVNMDFSNSTLCEIRFKLLPESRKPVTKSELKIDSRKSKLTKSTFHKKTQDKIEKVHNLYSALNELKELHENGLINHEEFMELRKEVMGK